MSHDHFDGKSAHDHLIEARSKGAKAMHEHHGTEVTGSVSSALDTAKELTFVLTALYLLLDLFNFHSPQIRMFIYLFSFGYLFWKGGRSALLGWMRLERVHRLIEEEQHEIKSNRDQEKEELTELYQAKGFTGKLLDQVIDVLMADDNRLLEVMLQEELGLTLESYEHPLKQSFGALIGFLSAFVLLTLGEVFAGFYGIFLSGIIVMCATGYLNAKLQNNDTTRSIVWNVATFLLSLGIGYFFSKIVLVWFLA